jgi:hypothetical protein
MDSGPVIRVVAVAVLLLLIAVTVALTISATNENSRRNTLRHKGVPVQATVTACQGISSGVGMAIEYWDCRATYTLDGSTYNEVIKGSRGLLQPGQTVVAIAVPGEPGLSSAASAAAKHSSWTPYITPIVLGAVILALVGAFWWWSRRRHHPRRQDATADTPPRDISV